MRYSLRSLIIVVTIAAIPLGWWNHRNVCLARSESLFELAMKEKMASGNPCDSGLTVHKSKWLETLSAHHFSNARMYRRAAYRPWERLWISDSPPDFPVMTAATNELLYPE